MLNEPRFGEVLMKLRDLRRFGVIVPATNTAMEAELPHYLPVGTSVHFSRATWPGGDTVTREALLGMEADAERAAVDLAMASPEVILYGCTSGSFIRGAKREGVSEEIQRRTGVKTLTTTQAVLSALAHLQAQKVFLVTPYPDEINRDEIEYLESQGFAVTGHASFHCDDTRPINSLSSSDIANLVRQNLNKLDGAHAIFISCTDLLTFDQIAGLEDGAKLPVVTSNQATLWAALKAMDLPSPTSDLGTLFRK
ncbi:aspartate/glutamate racemase family protein [Bradyrhizobium sp. BRP14]|nr:aspartate/glutamate racemase family protein [Bradyrhizobium sp. BRP14]